MVLSEDSREDEPAPAEPAPVAETREDWLGLLFWLFGFGFLLALALWDMVAAFFR